MNAFVLLTVLTAFRILRRNRLRAGLTMQGGVNVGRSRLNDCDIWAQLPETQTGFVRTPVAFCDQSSG